MAALPSQFPVTTFSANKLPSGSGAAPPTIPARVTFEAGTAPIVAGEINMYRTHIAYVPALGQVEELRAALEEHVRASKAAGWSHALTELLFAPEPTLVNYIRHQSLAALEEYEARTASDPAYLARTARISACLARPQSVELYEDLGMVIGTTWNYVLQTTLYPAAGKAGAL